MTQKKKPYRRVPITAPPTTTTSTPTTTTTTTITSVTPVATSLNAPRSPPALGQPQTGDPGQDSEEAVSAPVFYEDSDHQLRQDPQHLLHEDGGGQAHGKCETRMSRGLAWRGVGVGKTQVAPCPNNPESTAEWKCLEGDRWAHNWPNLSRCRSKWVEETLLQRPTNHHGSPDLRHPVERIFNYLSQPDFSLYGGDLAPILGVVQNRLRALLMEEDLAAAAGPRKDSFRTLVSILSRILEARSAFAWRDLLGGGNATLQVEDRVLTSVEHLGELLALSGSDDGPASDPADDIHLSASTSAASCPRNMKAKAIALSNLCEYHR